MPSEPERWVVAGAVLLTVGFVALIGEGASPLSQRKGKLQSHGQYQHREAIRSNVYLVIYMVSVETPLIDELVY